MTQTPRHATKFRAARVQALAQCAAARSIAQIARFVKAPMADTVLVLHVVLFQPEIPPNTGNVIRLCANTGAALHLVRPLGFELDDAKLRRAGLDYHEFAAIAVHDDLAAFIATAQPRRLFALSTRGRVRYDTIDYAHGDALLFGPETRGLPQAILDGIAPEQRLRLPMRPHNRSLNLSNTVAIVVYEAWRQAGFGGAA